VLVPTAAAGALCVYEGLNSSSPSVFPPDGGSLGTAGPTGAILSVIGGPDAFAYGSWAVTA
jgi:hypothetical protein